MKYYFLGSGRCFHTEDWYRSSIFLKDEYLENIKEIGFITDQLAGEGVESFLSDKDIIKKLFVIDFLLFKHFSMLGSIWRNIIKIIFLPLQIFLLRNFLRNSKDQIIVHAHSTYYAFIASFANCYYISTPQGSEVLVRPKNIFYRLFAKRAHKKAALITVDSSAMKDKVLKYFGLNAQVFQNGIFVEKFNYHAIKSRKHILSIRGAFPNYRLVELLQERNLTNGPHLDFCFPFSDPVYLNKVSSLLSDFDNCFGKLSRDEYHDVLFQTKFVISIPASDSSPRSVYEAIFAGCIAIVSNNRYIDDLPVCMRERIVAVDVSKTGWLNESLIKADSLAVNDFTPSNEAIEAYSQKVSMKRIIDLALLDFKLRN